MTALTLRQGWQTIDWEAPWPRHLRMLALTAAALLLLFARDVADMVDIWWNASTYTHCLFILPLAGWLVWQRKDELAQMEPAVWLPGLAIVGAGSIGWVLGEAGGIALFRHAGLVLMLQGAIIAVLGRQVALAKAFPIFYLSFMVPFGEELVPMLQTITAKMCMILLALTGVPASIDGVFITTPAGLFEVAEACSGVKFLVAMSAYATLASNVCFSTWPRRLVFLAFALTVPVLANGVRAFGTIWISEKTGIEFAASFDHIVYGWFFFGAVMLLVMAASWKFFNRKLDDAWVSPAIMAMAAPAKPRRPIMGFALTLLIALVGMGWQAGMGALGRHPMTNLVTMPDVTGWVRVPPRMAYPWEPRFDGADHRLTAHFANASGQHVDVVIAIYGWQEEGREMVGFGQGTFDPESEWSCTRATKAPEGGKSDIIFAPGAEREVAAFYVMDGMVTGSGTRVKLNTLKARLTGGDQAAVAILVSAEDYKGHSARAAIDGFLTQMGPIAPFADRMIDQAQGR